MKNIFKFSTFIILLTTTFPLFSQQYFFKNFSINEGLPQSTVYSLLQDSRGFIWMGTEGGGVFKFDGKHGKTYNRSNGLSGNIVRSLLEDSKGNIWIGTDNGLTIYDGYNFNSFTDTLKLLNTTILKIYESHNGYVWLATNDAGLYCIKNINDSIKYSNYTIQDGLISNFAFDIYEDKHNRIWLAMAGGISICEFDNNEITVTKLAGGYEIPDNLILSIEGDSKGRIWCSSYTQGAFYFENYENIDNLKYKILNNKALTNNTIWDIKSDNDGSVWFASDKNGLINLSKKNEVSVYNENNGLVANQIACLLKDKTDKLWMGTVNHGAILFPGKQIVSYTEKDNLPSNNITGFLKLADNNFIVASAKGVSIANFRNQQITITKNILHASQIKTVTQGVRGEIFIASGSEIFQLKDDTSIKYYQVEDNSNTTINQIYCDREANLWVATSNGYLKFNENQAYRFNVDDGLINNEIQSIIEDRDGNIWMATLGGLVKINGANYTDYNEVEGLSAIRTHTLCEDSNGDIWIGSFGGGLFKLVKSQDTLPIQLMATQPMLTSNNIYSILLLNDSTLVVATDKGFDILTLDANRNIGGNISYYQKEGFLIGENNLNAVCKKSHNEILFGTGSGFTKFKLESTAANEQTLFYITDIQLFFKSVDWSKKNTETQRFLNTPANFNLKYNENHLTFENTSVSFIGADQIAYSFRLLGQSNDWSPFTNTSQQIFSSLKPGHYSFQVKVKNMFGHVSQPTNLTFQITPPFWQTIWFYLIVIITLTGTVFFYIRYRERKLRADKIKLERIVRERTAEVVKQKNEITDSINYASRIQNAMLPAKHKTIGDKIQSFVFFKPRDIVSGDFYWIDHIDEYSIYIAADCTGHGVPGAFMSMLGISLLNEIIINKKILSPGDILTELRAKIKFALKQQGIEGETKDGMDIAASVINRKTLKLEFAGAYNPVLILRKNQDTFELTEIKADRMPIGIYIKEKESFTNNEFQLEDQDTLYIFSDGYIDQFGGENGGKYKIKQFKTFLESIQLEPFCLHKELLKDEFERWKGKHEQVDDILVIGIEVKKNKGSL